MCLTTIYGPSGLAGLPISYIPNNGEMRIAIDAANKKLFSFISKAAELPVINIGTKLELVLDLVKDWKMSAARGGARTALTLAKAHNPKLNLDIITSGFPEVNEDGTPVNEVVIRLSVLGYNHLCALGTHMDVYYEHQILPDFPSDEGASAMLSDALQVPNGGDEISSVPPTALGTLSCKFVGGKQCIILVPERVCNIT
jgi:hypothetical protein